MARLTPTRFLEIAKRFAQLEMALLGDVCLDRYFEIDPARREVSIETGLEVRNVERVRCQPGAAGTILNNLAALGVGVLLPVGCCGEDGEGFELRRALAMRPGVRLDHFFGTPERTTFTYTKPLLMHPGRPPEELNRIDQKNWTPTPAGVESRLRSSVRALADRAHAWIVMDQVDVPETGVVTRGVLEEVGRLARERPSRFIVADSRRGLAGFPPLSFKMNASELARLLGVGPLESVDAIGREAARLASKNGRVVFVTLAERGMVGAAPDGKWEHVPSHPIRGAIDIVGAGDAVTANLTASVAAGATLREAMEVAQAAASIVIHQLGTTGTASPSQIAALLSASSNCNKEHP